MKRILVPAILILMLLATAQADKYVTVEGHMFNCDDPQEMNERIQQIGLGEYKPDLMAHLERLMHEEGTLSFEEFAKRMSILLTVTYLKIGRMFIEANDQCEIPNRLTAKEINELLWKTHAPEYLPVLYKTYLDGSKHIKK